MVELKDIIKDGTIVVLINGLAAFLAYLTRIMIARNLTIYEVGLFFGVLNFITFFTFLRSWGLDASLSKYIAEFKIKNKNDEIKTVIFSAALSQFIFSLIVISVIYIISNFLVKNYFHNEDTRFILYTLCWVLLANSAGNVFKGIFRGFKKMFYFAIIELVDSSYIFLIIIFLGIKLPSMVFAYITSGLCVLIFGIIILHTFWKYKDYKIINFKYHTIQLFKIGIPVMLAGFGGMIISYINNLILIYFRPMNEIGIYSMILPFAMVALFFTRAGFSAVIPSVSETSAYNHHHKIKDFIKESYKMLPLIAIPISIGIIFAKPFIRIFLGESYLPGASALQILLVGVFFYIIVLFNSNIMIGIGKPLPISLAVIFSGIFNTVLGLSLVPTIGINGAAIATSISFVICCVLSIFIIIREIKHEKYTERI